MGELEPDPLVLMGPPRSGTTYLGRIFDAHPEVAMTDELRVFGWMRRAFVDLTQLDDALLVGRAEFVEWLREALPELLRGYYRKNAPHVRWWGDKNPHYAQDPVTLETIRELFPGARFVMIYRDPRSVIASLSRKRHADGQPWAPLDVAHTLVVEHFERAIAFRDSLPDGVFHVVRYEDLVADDEGVARELFGALGIPFATEVERFCREQTVQRTPFSGPTSAELGARGRAAARRAWREAVPEAERERSFAFLAPWLLQLGYEDAASLDEERAALG